MSYEKKISDSLRIEYGDVTVDRVSVNNFGKPTATLRQDVTVFNSFFNASSIMQDALTTDEESTRTQKRVAFVPCDEDDTVESVQAKISSLAEAGKEPCIYRIISHNVCDVMTPSQKAAADSSEYDYSWEDAMEKHVIKNKDGNIIVYAKNSGEMELQFRATYFSSSYRGDSDLRDDIDSSKLGNDELITEFTSVEEYLLFLDEEAEKAAETAAEKDAYENMK